MRFAELDLIRYGRFQDCRLTFARPAPGAPDIHIVFGPNEAGKSTTMAAVSDLLFGFPTRSPYAFRFDTSMLRIGAVLENEGETFAFRRRKGNKATLIDARDQPLDEAPLAAMLRGQTREVFRLSSSLDHQRLREGGRAIVDAKDDVGRAVFAAGSGLVGVARALQALETEADDIWGKRASDRRTYSRAQKDYEESRRLVRDRLLKPRDWSLAKAESDLLEDEAATLEHRQRDVNGELRAAQRVLRILGPARRHFAVSADILERSVVALTPAMEANADAALAQASDAERARTAAVALLEDVRDRLAAVQVDRAILDRADVLEALLTDLGAIRKAAEDLPGVQAELQSKRRTQTELRADLGLADTATAGDRLPSKIAVATLRELARQRARDDTAAATVRDALGEQERLRDTRAAQMADAPVPEGLATLAAVVKAVTRLGDLDAASTENDRAADRAEANRALAFDSLVPWRGGTDDLARMAVPSDAEIDAARETIDVAQASASAEQGIAVDRADSLDRLKLDRDRLAQDGEAVPPEAVAEARDRREAGWRTVRAHLTGTPLEDPDLECRRFESLVQEADTLADRRFLSAEASGRLSGMDAQAEQLRLQKDQAERRRDAATAAEIEGRRLWRERLTGLGLPDLTPLQTRTWCALRIETLTRCETAAGARQAATAATDALVQAGADLMRALGSPAEEEGTPLSVLVERAERRLETGKAQEDVFVRLKDEHRAAQEAVAASQRRLATLDQAEATWRASWAEATRQAGLTLSSDGAEARLDVYETLRGSSEAIGDLELRIAGIERDRSHFDARVAAVVAALGWVDDGRSLEQRIDALRTRLVQARADAQIVQTLTEAENQQDDAIRRADATRDAAERSLIEVMALTGATDRAGVGEAVQASRTLRDAQAERDDLERQIVRDGDGLALADLLAACQDQAGDALSARVQTLDVELAGLNDDVADAARKAGGARKTFEALDQGPSAADAAADGELARAEMDVQAQAYLLKRTQAVMLRWAMERYRERRQNPLLKRAGDIFGTLTLGGYVDLRVDVEAATPRLLGLCEDGQTLVDVEAMSEGTVDQLYLALRLAAVEQAMETGVRLPFLADDLFVNFDDERARAGFQVLGELAKTTQVLFFTHHAHLLPIAQEVLGATAVSTCHLPGSA